MAKKRIMRVPVTLVIETDNVEDPKAFIQRFTKGLEGYGHGSITGHGSIRKVLISKEKTKE